jgi:hypothetical protein
MPRFKPIVARTPEELAKPMGLSAAAAKEWQVQHALLRRLKEIVKKGEDDSRRNRDAGWYFANEDHGNPE